MRKISERYQPKLVPILEILVSGIDYDDLPHEWRPKNIADFSKRKRLFDYQVEALKNAIKGLFLFYQEQYDAQEVETSGNDKLLLANKEYEILVKKRKTRFYGLIASFLESIGGEDILELLCIEGKKGAFSYLKEVYGSTRTNKGGRKVEIIEPYNFVNRMGFWMATGSGKTLVLIKLVEILDSLLQAEAIPVNNSKTQFHHWNFLVLSHREDLLQQLKQHVREFNEGKPRQIRLWNLKEFEEIQTLHKGLSWNSSINVFVYRSDLISDQTKEYKLSFRDIEANGSWFIFLDEAHKGTKEDSKRQHYYSILSRNGFLFNFSATFVEPWDIVATIYNFNLKEFISQGYRKNILLPHTDFVRFSKTHSPNDFSIQEKQQVILEALILLGLLVKNHKRITKVVSKDFGEVYHRPLLVVYGKEVNTTQADVKLFFEHLANVFRGRISKSIFSRAKESLIQLFSKEKNREFAFGTGALQIHVKEIESYTYDELMEDVFRARTTSNAEIIQNPWNPKELAIKLKSAEQPFALLKIGDVSNWLRTNLSGYQRFEKLEERSYFERLNRQDSPITILMGAQAFYEGWDSNRPNIILFINVGVGNAQKFIIQAVGRGVRINPFDAHRKRLAQLIQIDERARVLARKLSKQAISMIETLFLFGSNRENLDRILGSIEYVNTIIPKDISETLRTRKTMIMRVKRNTGTKPLFEGEDSEGTRGDEGLRSFITWLGKTREEQILKTHVLLQSRLGQSRVVQIWEIKKMLDLIEASNVPAIKEVHEPLEKLVLVYEQMFG